MKPILVDNFERKFEYLRLSIIDSCNFKCEYCLPYGFKPTSKEDYLSQNEIVNLVTSFAELGMWKVRFTGGEPTLRRDFIKLVTEVKNIDGVKKLVFSTNGFALSRFAKEYYDAGLRGVNVSIDSLNSEDFYKITAQNKLPEILKGLDKAQEVGFESIKINAVLLKNINDKSLNNFLEFIQFRNISVRFIELMQTLQNKEYFDKHHVSSAIIRDKLLEYGFSLKEREAAAGPAEVWTHPNFKGTVGLIAPYSKDFCTTCNRLRVSSRGMLRLCLFGTGGISLREYLQHTEQKEQLKEIILNALKVKKESHYLHNGNAGDTKNLSTIGG